MKKIVPAIILAAIMLAAVAAVPAITGAQIPDENWDQATDLDGQIAGWQRDMDTLWIAGRLPMDTERDARAAVRLTDAADIERNLGGTILAQDVSTDLAGYGVGPMQLYAGIYDAGHDMVVILTSRGSDVYVFVAIVPDISGLDAGAFAAWTLDVMLTGLTAAPGAGFVPVDADQPSFRL